MIRSDDTRHSLPIVSEGAIPVGIGISLGPETLGDFQLDLTFTGLVAKRWADGEATTGLSYRNLVDNLLNTGADHMPGLVVFSQQPPELWQEENLASTLSKIRQLRAAVASETVDNIQAKYEVSRLRVQIDSLEAQVKESESRKKRQRKEIKKLKATVAKNRPNLGRLQRRYNFGWSHGKEKLESGKADLFKGSFYANPISDTPTTDEVAIRRYPSYCRPNKWSDALPELEVAFKALGKLMWEAGLMLAYHCDQYVSKKMKDSNAGNLEQMLQRSRCHKGRLLYYFPRHSRHSGDDISSISSWCGWHTDNGSLTGLTCGLYTRDGVKITSPDSAAGLYVKTRNDEIVKVVFEEDELAYQIGETAEILAGRCLCATPHCVQAPNSEKALGVARSTFALFLQPDWDEKLQFPAEIRHHQELISPNRTLTFGEFSETLIGKYYHEKS
ncbi:hypothetical protein ZIOFF_056770 [Zingiber officinale]|uniref:Fe2OG dioxygenase domain-containing protein n=1 Tax=Zingiber officinale TaxID=94328 RepID=A0A8J5KFJ7_ZINOF|nr:hypothetical protein ZIOFF_056770 [Zingiber officinale]